MDEKWSKMEEVTTMIGRFHAKLDDKNRLFVPAKLREELGDTFFVTLGVNCRRRCLTVYTAADWQTVTENYNKLPISQRGAETSLLFMYATECEPDKQFRFTLTQSFKFTLYSNKRSISSLAFVPIFLSIAPCLPIIIPL